MPEYPQWLDLSGLPQHLEAHKLPGAAAWNLLRTILLIDCQQNTNPGTVDISMPEISLRTGLTNDQIRKAVNLLRKHKLLTAFIPTDDEENALFKPENPIPTPRTHADIARETPKLAGQCRYCPCAKRDVEPVNAILEETFDLYLNQCSARINQFILDKLTALAVQHPIERIRRAFRTAEKNQTHSLDFIIRECVREKRIEKENQNAF